MNDSLRKYHKTLLEIGIPANLSGFAYIVAAGYLIETNPDLYCMSPKCIYIDVAARFHTSPASIEKGIRYAIASGNIESYQLILQHGKKVIPTNKQFLLSLYYYIAS